MNIPLLLSAGLAAYFFLLLFVARLVACRRHSTNNDAFYRAHRRAPWPLVAVGMVAGSISGVSFVSVPGWVATTGMTYLQMCLGFFFGYLAVAFVLLPVYYRLRLTSIYTYLRLRFGRISHRTGALFFLISKLSGATVRLYLATLVLHAFIAAPLGIPFWLTIGLNLLLIWLYTRRTGQAGLLYTDVIQTLALVLALLGIIAVVLVRLDVSVGEAWGMVATDPMCRLFEWDMASLQAFWRQFLSGIFIVVVMTGLDQDMMQKNLTCRDLRSAQKDMCAYGAAFLPINALFLGLGILLHHVCRLDGIAPPLKGDELLPMLVAEGHLGAWAVLPFGVGIIAAAFSAADGAVTALTTSTCIDLFGREDDTHLRRRVHLAVVVVCYVCILAFDAIGSGNVIHAIYVLASYTYGPLLGLYAYGLFSSSAVRDRFVPAVCMAAPLLCFLLDRFAPVWWGYRFGYELLLFNGALTALGLWLLRTERRKTSPLEKK